MKPMKVKKTYGWRNRYCVINRLIVLLVAFLLEDKDIGSWHAGINHPNLVCFLWCVLRARSWIWSLICWGLLPWRPWGQRVKAPEHTFSEDLTSRWAVFNFFIFLTESFSKLSFCKESMIMVFSVSSVGFKLQLNTRTKTALKRFRNMCEKIYTESHKLV